jgi:hypothetical protein
MLSNFHVGRLRLQPPQTRVCQQQQAYGHQLSFSACRGPLEYSARWYATAALLLMVVDGSVSRTVARRVVMHPFRHLVLVPRKFA